MANQEKTRQEKPFINDQRRSPRVRYTGASLREWQTNLLEGRTIAATAARSSCSWVPVLTVDSATCCATSGSSHRLLKSNGCVADARRCSTPCKPPQPWQQISLHMCTCHTAQAATTVPARKARANAWLQSQSGKNIMQAGMAVVAATATAALTAAAAAACIA